MINYFQGGIMKKAAVMVFLVFCVSGAFADGPASVTNALAGSDQETAKERQPSWLLPEVVVSGQKAALVEEQKVGESAQPRWTATRRFPTTRVYVIPNGETEFEWWLRPTTDRSGYVQTEVQYEFEIGLPSRFQLDFYLTMEKDGRSGPLDLGGLSWEVRYALADWGKLPFNPTLYFEWEYQNNAPDKFEAKILFGDELAPRWHWGLNAVVEREVAGDENQEMSLRGGLSYTVSDMNFSVGLEGEATFADSNLTRGTYQQEYVLGPSVQWRPIPNFHADFAFMFGLTTDSPLVKSLIVVGWEL